jgi:uncharacterized YccA/Bax inhibitor family protein
MRTSNPTLSQDVFISLAKEQPISSKSNAMTIEGTVNKTGFFLTLTTATALFAWFSIQVTGTPNEIGGMVNPGLTTMYMLVGGIGSFIVAMLITFKKNLAMLGGMIYCLLEGLFIGGISAFAEAYYPGIAIQAGLLTFGTLFALLGAYKTGMIKVTQNFRLGVMAATGGICLVYLLSFGMSLFGFHMPYIHEGGLIGIGFSLFVIGIAAMNLVLDFDFIEKGSKSGAPKYMEWYAAFGLIVTLVWLYIEILRLLMKLQSRD